jgi:pilus assembly protein Flp/PilA
MKTIVAALIVDDSAQGLVEYALILLLVALVAISTLTFFGNKASNSLRTSGNKLS